MQKAKKKVIKTKTGTKTVRYGQKGATVSPGTAKGDSYCARRAGQMMAHPEAAADPNSPLRLSRRRWRCSGKRSRRK